MSSVATTVVGEAILEKVMTAVEREADFDVLATPTARRLGEQAGVSAITALAAVHRLADAKRLSIVGVVGRGGCLALQLPEVAS